MVGRTKMIAGNELEKAYRYCESVTKLHAKSFYFAAKFLPKHKQKAVYPIYAFCRHVDDEIDEIRAGNEAEAILAVEKWKQKLAGVFEGKRQKAKGKSENEEQNSKTENQNLVLTAWKDLLETYKIPQNLPLELMQGVLQDTHTKRYETFDELYVYCYRVASTVGLMSSEILGYSEKRALEYAEAMGIAMQLTNILRDVKEDAAMGRIYLPQEDLRKFGVSEEQIFAGKFDNKFAEMMKFQIERAGNFYAKGEKGIALLDKDSRFTVLLASRIYAKILDEIEKQNYNVFTKRAHTSKRQKIFAIPRIWLKAKKI
jgi:phytoene synthase